MIGLRGATAAKNTCKYHQDVAHVLALHPRFSRQIGNFRGKHCPLPLQRDDIGRTIVVGATNASTNFHFTGLARFLVMVTITREDFLKDRQGRTFADVLNDPGQPFDKVLEFFSNEDRQRRMEEAEIHHDRAPMAGVVRELEGLPAIHKFLGTIQAQRNQRLRQAIGVLVRMIMDGRGWKKTGKKGSLGVRSSRTAETPSHNSGGLAFWFVRAERYEQASGKPFPSVRKRCRELEAGGKTRPNTNGHAANGRSPVKRSDQNPRPGGRRSGAK